jgi:hypothetical protein
MTCVGPHLEAEFVMSYRRKDRFATQFGHSASCAVHLVVVPREVVSGGCPDRS